MIKESDYGEGNYAASRNDYKAAKKDMESGRAGQAARGAAPGTPAAVEMKQAEEAALLQARGARKKTPGNGRVPPSQPVDDPTGADDVPGALMRPDPSAPPDRGPNGC